MAQNSFHFENQLDDLLQMLPEEVEQRMQICASMIEGEVKDLLSGQRAGREYKVPATSKTWKASRPFEPPAVRLGDLRRKYLGFVEGSGIYSEGIVATPVDYAPHLEFGTRKMAQRPHLRKAAYNVLSQLENQFVGFFE
jgi:hypothetical protein